LLDKLISLKFIVRIQTNFYAAPFTPADISHEFLLLP